MARVVHPVLPRPDRHSALFLDVDGTLLDIAPHPGGVCVPSGLPETLTRLSWALDGAIALISGRTIADLDRIFAPLVLPAAGQHGGELRLSAGASIKVEAPPAQLGAFEPKLAAFLKDHPNVMVEQKGLGIAIHYRAAPAEEAAIDRFLRETIGEFGGDLTILKGKKVFEVKAGLTSKGTAVGYFMAHAPFTGRMPFFIGDDRTDEDGFAAVGHMGGHAIHIGAAHDSLAQSRLPNPAALRDWLDEVSRAITA